MDEKTEEILKDTRELCDTAEDPEYPLDVLVDKLGVLSDKLDKIGF